MMAIIAIWDELRQHLMPKSHSCVLVNVPLVEETRVGRRFGVVIPSIGRNSPVRRCETGCGEGLWYIVDTDKQTHMYIHNCVKEATFS